MSTEVTAQGAAPAKPDANPNNAVPNPAAPAAAAPAPAKPDANAAAAPADPNAAANAKADPNATPVVKYELKLPDGSPLQADQVEKIANFAKERGLTNDQAQAILQRDHEAQVLFAEANKPGGVEWNKRVQDWEKAALADKEIGGSEEALKANAELGRRVLTKFFPETVAKFLVDSGFGSHPDVIRGFNKLGRMMKDDELVMPGANAAAKRSIENVFYPETKE